MVLLDCWSFPPSQPGHFASCTKTNTPKKALYPENGNNTRRTCKTTHQNKKKTWLHTKRPKTKTLCPWCSKVAPSNPWTLPARLGLAQMGLTSASISQASGVTAEMGRCYGLFLEISGESSRFWGEFLVLMHCMLRFFLKAANGALLNIDPLDQ